MVPHFIRVINGQSKAAAFRQDTQFCAIYLKVEALQCESREIIVARYGEWSSAEAWDAVR